MKVTPVETNSLLSEEIDFRCGVRDIKIQTKIFKSTEL